MSKINRIQDSYENLHDYEIKGCSFDEIKNELHSIQNSTEELQSLMMQLFKENTPKVKGVDTLANIFKITYLPTLKIHLLYLSQIKESDKELLKIQSRLAITYMNIDGCIDSLRIIHAYLK